MELNLGNYLIGLLNGTFVAYNTESITEYNGYSALLTAFNFILKSGINKGCINYFALGCASLDKVNSINQFFPTWLQNQAIDRPVNIIAIDHFFQNTRYHFIVDDWKKEDGYYSHPTYPHVRAFIIGTLIPTQIPNSFQKKFKEEIIKMNEIATQEFYQLWENIIHLTADMGGSSLICNYCVFVSPPIYSRCPFSRTDINFFLFPEVLTLAKKQNPRRCILMTGTKFDIGHPIILQLVPYLDTKCINTEIYLTDFILLTKIKLFRSRIDSRTQFRGFNYYYCLSINKEGEFVIQWDEDILIEIYSLDTDIKKKFFQSSIIKKTTLPIEQAGYIIKESLKRVLENWISSLPVSDRITI